MRGFVIMLMLLSATRFLGQLLTTDEDALKRLACLILVGCYISAAI